jgi:hypothetical protein
MIKSHIRKEVNCFISMQLVIIISITRFFTFYWPPSFVEITTIACSVKGNLRTGRAALVAVGACARLQFRSPLVSYDKNGRRAGGALISFPTQTVAAAACSVE